MTVILGAVFVSVPFAVIAWLIVRAERRERERDPYRDLGLVQGHRVIRRENNQEF
jgi:hypothetical protein